MTAPDDGPRTAGPVRWVTAFLDLPAAVHEAGTAFWLAATGSTLSAERGEEGQFATLLPPDGDAYLKVQRLEGGPRVHLDLHVDDVGAQADRAVALGAAVLLAAGHVVLASPAGVVHCLVGHQVSGRRPEPVEHGGALSLVDQVALDVPAVAGAGEIAYWSALTGWAAPDGDPRELTPLHRPAGQPLRLMVQRLGVGDSESADGADGDAGPAGARAHLDIAAGPTRAATTAAHVALGAEVLDVRERWTVLRDPAGLAYCLTDRDPRTGVLAR